MQFRVKLTLTITPFLDIRLFPMLCHIRHIELIEQLQCGLSRLSLAEVLVLRDGSWQGDVVLDGDFYQ